MKRILALIFMIAVMGFSSMAAETTVGAAPDPYEKIWESCTEDDLRALCRVCYWESARADAPIEVTKAVVETVLNRVLDPEWPNTIENVCTDRKWGKQFECKYYGDVSHDDEITEAIEYVKANGRTVLPDYDYEYFATRKQSYAKDYVLIGNPEQKYGYMYFGRKK